MSRFIAHTITFSKDFKTYRLKGGDNNVVPRFNSWTRDIDIMHLYNDINGGMVELIGTSEKNAIIREVVNRHNYDGAYYTDWCYNYDKVEKDEKFVEFNKAFEADLIKTLKESSNKKLYYIKFNSSFVRKVTKTHVKLTYEVKYAKKFTEYRAKEIAKSYGNHNPIVTLTN